jgi:hypothetical protein
MAQREIARRVFPVSVPHQKTHSFANRPVKAQQDQARIYMLTEVGQIIKSADHGMTEKLCPISSACYCFSFAEDNLSRAEAYEAGSAFKTTLLSPCHHRCGMPAVRVASSAATAGGMRWMCRPSLSLEG